MPTLGVALYTSRVNFVSLAPPPYGSERSEVKALIYY